VGSRVEASASTAKAGSSHASRGRHDIILADYALPRSMASLRSSGAHGCVPTCISVRDRRTQGRQAGQHCASCDRLQIVKQRLSRLVPESTAPAPRARRAHHRRGPRGTQFIAEASARLASSLDLKGPWQCRQARDPDVRRLVIVELRPPPRRARSAWQRACRPASSLCARPRSCVWTTSSGPERRSSTKREPGRARPVVADARHAECLRQLEPTSMMIVR